MMLIIPVWGGRPFEGDREAAAEAEEAAEATGAAEAAEAAGPRRARAGPGGPWCREARRTHGKGGAHEEAQGFVSEKSPVKSSEVIKASFSGSSRSSARSSRQWAASPSSPSSPQAPSSP